MSWQVPENVKQEWLAECRLAATDDKAFSTFKRGRTIGYVTENKHAGHAVMYWAMAKHLFPVCRTHLPELSDADRVGGPLNEDVAIVDGYRLSGTTALSALRCAQIIGLFGRRPNRIAEIGAGYGNLANCLKIFGLVKDYTVFDLPEPALLQKRYISHFGWVARWARAEQDCGDFDLSISDSSLSELSEEGRACYDAILAKSRYGFHVWNRPDTPTGMDKCSSLFPQDPPEMWTDCYSYTRA